MIVSHEHKFIFLKTKKTAGTSLELGLRRFCGPDDVITPVSPQDELLAEEGPGAQNWWVHGWWQSRRPLYKRRWFRAVPQDHGFYNHMPAAEAKALIGDDRIWNSYFKFAFDRNPWDRQVSYYHHCFRGKDKKPSFSHFMHHDRRARLNNFEIYSVDGESCVDFLGRYENLIDDLGKALGELGLCLDCPLPRAKGGFRTNKAPYQSFYDEETRNMVAAWYPREIALLDYSF
ncbi:sulfotransferase family 2 domain-containing protein [Methyloligella sp. 2.7D]|uniref:sulfotransferase family 2 domain-containing protein n=1 Tax=unclassified Methyloligella TaxID=2625955 RepID=UPI00157CDCEB|nr:sulfotransferase family 2 domain-containing protein [Methyloligella sp. GL2]QKP78026.1 sulfotransferase family 2 domain-containing protein [Methyloligella sp. GL2]